VRNPLRSRCGRVCGDVSVSPYPTVDFEPRRGAPSLAPIRKRLSHFVTAAEVQR